MSHRAVYRSILSASLAATVVGGFASTPSARAAVGNDDAGRPGSTAQTTQIFKTSSTLVDSSATSGTPATLPSIDYPLGPGRPVHVCNYTNHQVDIAHAQEEQGLLTSRGWQVVDNSTCKDFHAYYVFAHASDNFYYRWQIDGRADYPLCVALPGPFTIYEAQNPAHCSEAHGMMVNFSVLPEGQGTLNWNLTP